MNHDDFVGVRRGLGPSSLTCSRGGDGMFWVNIIGLVVQVVQLGLQTIQFLLELNKQK